MPNLSRSKIFVWVALMSSTLFLLAACTGGTSGMMAPGSMDNTGQMSSDSMSQQEQMDLDAQMTNLTAMWEQMQSRQESGSPMSMSDSVEQMTTMLGQMQDMVAAMPESDSATQMGPQMMGVLGGMMGMTQGMVEDMQDMPMDESRAQLMSQMIGMISQMMGTMGKMQGMMGDAGMGMMDAKSPTDNQDSAMTSRQAEVAERGAQVMLFDLEQTTHVFKELDNGGLQQVLVKEGADADQVAEVQMHLAEEAKRFSQGDFSDPAQIHGEEMPGLAVLRQRADEVDVRYTALDNGAQLEYISDSPELVAAIHDWFGAQLADHGAHATEFMPMDNADMSGMMAMMGQMMSMMGQMQGMMGPGMGMGATMPFTGTMPMDNADMSGMMAMMGQMMSMMGQMQDTTDVDLEPTESNEVLDDLTQTAQVGAITVIVTPLNFQDAETDTLDFNIAFDTHSVEMDFDFADLIVLNVDDTEVAATSWESPTSGGHHVSGILSFPATDSDGESLLATATEVALILQDLGGNGGYTFTWNLGNR